MSEGKEKPKRESKFIIPNVTIELGKRLKAKRNKIKFSLSDAGELTGVSSATIVDIESGVTVNINYYIGYAQTLNYKLSELIDLDIEYNSRFSFNSKKTDRTFLTDNIKSLYTDHNFFNESRSVNDVVLKLKELQVIKELTPVIRSKTSSVLATLVANKILFVDKVIGRKKLYLKFQ